MIIKSFETHKINLNKNQFLLLYGKNEGFKNQIKINLLKDKTITSNYDEIEIINKPNEFFENLSSRSLFETEKIIFIKRATDKILKIISELVEKKFENLIIIIDSESLEKKSKLRAFFEKSKDCICIPFYPDTNETLSKLALHFLKKKNISISSSNINLIVNRCNGDRKILHTELEKISNYQKNGKKINAKIVAKLTNLAENHSISELIDNCLAKNKSKTLNILVENNFSSDDCIIITRTFINKLKKILVLSKEFQKNNNINMVISIAKPPIFWKEKEITKQQIINWTPDAIKEILYKLNEVELLIKKNYDNSISIIIDFILDLVTKKVNN